MEKLKKERVSQWEDGLLQTIITALPRCTPKKLESILEEVMKTEAEIDAKATENAYDAIAVLRDNANGIHPRMFWSEPFQILWCECLVACATQRTKWKFFPLVVLHSFANRVNVMCSATGKNIPISDLNQMLLLAKSIRDTKKEVYNKIERSLARNDKSFVDGLKEIFPDALKQIPIGENVSGMKDIYASDDSDGVHLRHDKYGNIDGENTSTTTDHPSTTESEDNEGDTVTSRRDELGPVISLTDSEADEPVRTSSPVAKPETSTDKNDDFSISLSESVVQACLSTTVKPASTPKEEGQYSSVPPPSSPAGKYSEVAPPTPLGPPATSSVAQIITRNHRETVLQQSHITSRSVLQTPDVFQPMKSLGGSSPTTPEQPAKLTKLSTPPEPVHNQRIDEMMKQMRLHAKTLEKVVEQQQQQINSLIQSNHHMSRHVQSPNSSPQRSRMRSLPSIPVSPIASGYDTRRRTRDLIYRESLGGIVPTGVPQWPERQLMPGGHRPRQPTIRHHAPRPHGPPTTMATKRKSQD